MNDSQSKNIIQNTCTQSEYVSIRIWNVVWRNKETAKLNLISLNTHDVYVPPHLKILLLASIVNFFGNQNKNMPLYHS